MTLSCNSPPLEVIQRIYVILDCFKDQFWIALNIFRHEDRFINLGTKNKDADKNRQTFRDAIDEFDLVN